MSDKKMDNSFEITDYPRSWVKDKYQEVQALINKREAKCDPNQLYEKKCKAIEILLEILDVLTKETFCTVMIATTHLNIGILQADVQDMEIAKEYFMSCIKLLEKCKLTPEGILPAISANNQMGIVYAQQGSYQKAKDYLEQAESIYVKFTEGKLDPIHMVAIMGIEEIEGDLSAKNVLEKLHTLTLYYLAQVCRELDDKCNFALYCHRTLSKQLSQNKITQDLDYIDWALNAATISQYFIENDKFPQARHHLAAASCVLEKYSEIFKAKDTEEISEDMQKSVEYENYCHRSADIARCWAKYGIALLSTSKERLMKSVEQEDETNNSKHAEISNEDCKYPDTSEAIENPKFVDLEPELEVITNEITDKYLLDYDDAKPVFLNIQKWLNKAKQYYSFENHASDYACIAQDMSQAYKYLAFYEEDEDRQAKMHKRRIDTLEEVSQGLSPRFYRNICREIWLELAETYSKILEIKIDRLQALNDKPTNQMIAKIERLARNSIKHYQLYVNSLEMKESNDGIASFSHSDLYQALYSYFHIGALYNKIIIYSSPDQKIENIEKSLEAYSFVANYYDKHPDIQEEFKKYEFIKLSKEFVDIMPLTLDKLR